MHTRKFAGKFGVLLCFVVLNGVSAGTNLSVSPTTITFYCPCEICCGDWSVFRRTASGTIPKAGRTVAAPTYVPFGTKVYIKGFGQRIVEDRTQNGNGWDVFVNTHAEAVRLGVQRRIIR